METEVTWANCPITLKFYVVEKRSCVLCTRYGVLGWDLATAPAFYSLKQ